jgi:hypothetical protein
MRLARYLVLVVAIVGCSDSRPYRTAAVSGRVTLDGQPLARARVLFHPVHTAKDGLLSGPQAYGETDSDGKYSLTTVFKEKGATVGRNRVMISTGRLEATEENDRAKNARVVAREKVPQKYFTDKAPLHFDVPAEGTYAANFDLTTR